MEVRVLGPLEVARQAEPAALPGAKPRQLLALLALRPNQPVPAEVLIDELWDQSPPSTAASALRVHLTRVRRLLEWADSPAEVHGAAPRLSLDAAGYVLRLAPDELDVTRFERLVACGKEAVLLGDLHDGQRSLRSALSVWRGPALVDVRDLSAAQAAVARLEQLRLGAIEELAEVRVILGDAAVADWLVEVVAEYPLHEGLVGQLMRSLDRSGRAADALRVYRRLQCDLDEQLGVAPSAELRKLEEDILLQRAGRQGDRHGGTTRVELRGSAARRFVGRRTEMERLLDLDHAAVGLVLVEGEAGVGKTALVDEYCRRAPALDDVTILTGRCVDGEVDEYHAVKALLGDAFPHGTDERHAVADYEADHARLLDGIANALGAMRPQRVLLVVEDLHWAGRATLRVLRHVLRHPDLGNVRVLATLRSDETHGALADRITTLCSRARTVRLALRGLDEFEVRALVRSTAPPDVAPTLSELAREIWAATSGNPFHVRALLQEFDDTGLQAQRTDLIRAGIAKLAPAGVRQLLDRRLARLAPSAVEVVQTASVFGADVSLSTLGSLCDLPAGELLDAVDQAIDAHILVEDETRVGVVAFEHALLRNSAYVSIGEPDREIVHARVASVFRNVDDDRAPRRAAEVAHHLLRSGPHADGELIVEFARHAGDDAFEELAFDDAAHWYERALEHCSPDAAVARPAAELLLALGRAFEADREFARAHDAYVRGASLCGLDDAALRADLVIAASGPWISLSDDPEQRARIRASIAEIGDRDPERQFRLIIALAASLYHVDPAAQADLAEEALARARALGGDARLARAHISRHLSLTHEPTACRERLATAETALRHACASSDRALELGVRREMLSDLLECGRRAAFDRALDDYERAAAAASMPRDMYRTMVLRATQKILDGDLAAGEQFARGASLRGRALGLEAAGAEFLQQFVVRYQQGRLAEMVPALGGAGPVMAENRAGGALAAVAYAVTRQPDDARRMADWVLGGGTLARDSFWLGAHALLAAAAVAIADVSLATTLTDALTPAADQVIVFGSGGAVLGSGHHWLGQLALVRGEVETAIEYLEAADRVAVEMRAPYWIACARRAQGAALTKLGRPADRDRAAALTADALHIASHQGFRTQ